MSYKKIIYGCLLAVLLIGPILQNVEARRYYGGYGHGWGWHHRGFFGLGVGPWYYNRYPYYSNPYYYNPYYNPYYYGQNYYRPYYRRAVYYPTYQTYGTGTMYSQQPMTTPSTMSTVPSDIQAMRPYQLNAMITIRYVDLSKISDANKQRALMQQRDAVMGLGNQFDAEYRKYENMLQSNDVGLSTQEGALRSIFESFKAQYENFVNAVNSQ